jgi:hypothetical protein
LAACREAVAICRVSDRGHLGGMLHDTAFMAVNAGEPLPEAEQMYREALCDSIPPIPFCRQFPDSRLGCFVFARATSMEGERLLRDAEPALRGKGEPLIEIVPVLYAARLKKTCGAITRRPSG